MKNSVIAILVVAVLVVGGGYLLLRSSNDGAPESEVSTETQENQQQLAGSFAALVRAGNDVRCDFSQGQGTTTTSGRISIADRGERIRGDFVVSQDGKPMEAHMIRVNGWNYIWSSAQPQGMKMHVTALNREKLFERENGGIPEDVQYNCVEGGIDNSLFTVPTNVEFMEISAMMGTGANGNADMKATQCGACEQAGPAREQCRVALGCEIAE